MALLAPPAFSCELAWRDRVQQLTAKVQGEGAAIAVVAAHSKVGSPWLINLAGDRYFVPASLVKLFTTAAALELFQPDFRISTRLWGSGVNNGRVDRLILEGNGDPSFNSAQLRRLVQQLTQAGIKRVGTIQLRDRLAAQLPSGWEWQDLVAEYGAVPHGLVINFNALAWQVQPGKHLGDRVIFRWQTPELATGWQVENRALTVEQGGQIEVERQLDQPKLTITGSLALNDGGEQGATVVLDPRANFQGHLELELKRQGIWLESELAPQPEPNSKHPPEQILAVVYSPRLKELVSTT
ncbi:MAG: D-alanyl-D-alanine carboxypeptidase/D-alanyl-D-alanine-endopeptidase, partial [Pseudanabaenaceae cyanobacterium bins.68]|nr:D-alanyl-D-alanine carboxypeptidase/D-alanyl-D-alanine-endopeptidase [Pseudanabaenaceae cyanobacterium bins.68]